MKKTVVYSMSRMIYQTIVPSLNSLLNNGGIDEVFILAQDDDIGLNLPENIRVINVSNQTWFDPAGPNFNKHWTYMSLMQAALAKIFPKLDRILNLDIDTIIKKDLSALWDLDMTDYYFAAALEVNKEHHFDVDYYNCGVTFWNLAKMRADKKDDEIIQALNTTEYKFANQDAENELCAGKILALPNEYNVSWYTGLFGPVRIRHFAAEGWGWFDNDPLVQMYKA